MHPPPELHTSASITSKPLASSSNVNAFLSPSGLRKQSTAPPWPAPVIFPTWPCFLQMSRTVSILSWERERPASKWWLMSIRGAISSNFSYSWETFWSNESVTSSIAPITARRTLFSFSRRSATPYTEIEVDLETHVLTSSMGSYNNYLLGNFTVLGLPPPVCSW